MNNTFKYRKLLGTPSSRQLFFILFFLPFLLPSKDNDIPQKISESKQILRTQKFWETRLEEAYPNLVEIDNNISNGDVNTLSTDWQLMGPNKLSDQEANNRKGIGRFNCIEFDPLDTDQIWAGSSSGGIWKSNDKGNSWTYVNTGHMNTGVSDIYKKGDNIYVVTGDHVYGGITRAYSVGVLRSKNNGESWEILDFSISDEMPDKFARIWVDPNDPEHFVLTSSKGLYTSFDGGESIITNNEDLAFRDIEQDPLDADLLYAATYSLGQKGYVYRSTNGGQSWIEVVYFVNAGNIELSTQKNNPDVIYALCIERTLQNMLGLWRSPDKGENWYQMNVPLDLIEAQGFYNLALKVLENGDIYAGGINLNIYENEEWRKVTSIHVDQHFIEQDDHTDEIYVCNDGGIFKRNEDTWEFVSNGIPATEFYRISSSKFNNRSLIGGSQDNGVLLNFYNKWENVLSGDGFSVKHDIETPSDLIVSIQKGKIFKSKDHGFNYGQNLSPSILNSTFFTRFELSDKDPDHMIYFTNRIFESKNGGVSWEMILDLYEDPILSAQLIGDSIIFAHKNNLMLLNNYKIDTLATLEHDINSIKYVSDQIFITCKGIEGSRVFKYSNNEVFDLTYDLINIPSNDIDSYEDRVFLASDIGVFELIDNNWYLLQDEYIPYMIVSDIEVNNGSGELFIASYGNGSWKLDLEKCLTQVFDLNYSGIIQLCKNEIIELEIESIDLELNEVTWSDGSQSSKLEVNRSGKYYASIYNKSSGCVYPSSVVEVDVIKSPEINISRLGEPEPCFGDTITLMASASFELERVRTKWNDGSDGRFIYVTEPGEYFLNYQYENGCVISSDTINLEFKDSPPSITIEKLNDKLISNENADWYFNDELLKRNTESIQVENVGTYYCQITNSNGCSSLSNSIIIGGESILSNAYPSAFTNKLSIEVFNEANTFIDILFVDLKGRKILEKRVFNEHDYYFEEIDSSLLQSGIYFLKIINENKERTIKLIKL